MNLIEHIKFYGVIRPIKWAYQRVTREYDDRIYWSFESYFLNIIPPLKRFCREQLKEMGNHELNSQRVEIYKKTLELIEICESDGWLDDKQVSVLFEYVGKHIGWYWD